MEVVEEMPLNLKTSRRRGSVEMVIAGAGNRRNSVEEVGQFIPSGPLRATAAFSPVHYKAPQAAPVAPAPPPLVARGRPRGKGRAMGPSVTPRPQLVGPNVRGRGRAVPLARGAMPAGMRGQAVRGMRGQPRMVGVRAPQMAHRNPSPMARGGPLPRGGQVRGQPVQMRGAMRGQAPSIRTQPLVTRLMPGGVGRGSMQPRGRGAPQMAPHGVRGRPQGPRPVLTTPQPPPSPQPPQPPQPRLMAPQSRAPAQFRSPSPRFAQPQQRFASPQPRYAHPPQSPRFAHQRGTGRPAQPQPMRPSAQAPAPRGPSPQGGARALALTRGRGVSVNRAPSGGRGSFQGRGRSPAPAMPHAAAVMPPAANDATRKVTVELSAKQLAALRSLGIM